MRALIGLSAVGYCAGKPTGKIKAIDHKFLWFMS